MIITALCICNWFEHWAPLNNYLCVRKRKMLCCHFWRTKPQAHTHKHASNFSHTLACWLTDWLPMCVTSRGGTVCAMMTDGLAIVRSLVLPIGRRWPVPPLLYGLRTIRNPITAKRDDRSIVRRRRRRDVLRSDRIVMETDLIALHCRITVQSGSAIG